MNSLIENNALSSLASGITSGATSFSVATGEGALFPAISNNLEEFYVKIGNDASNEVVRCTARSSDVFTCDATSSSWLTGDVVSLTANKELFSNFPRIINYDVTVTVAPSGADFVNIETALAALKNTVISSDVTVTLSVLTGIHSSSLTITDGQLCSDRIAIVGSKTTLTTSSNNAYSSSGSSGNWSIVVSLDSGTDMGIFTSGQLVIALDANNDGSGCHKITSIDTGNKRITLKNVSKKASAPSTGAGSTLVLLGSTLQNHYFSITGKGFKSIDDIGIDCPSTSSSGISIYSGAKLNINQYVGIFGPNSNYTTGIYISHGGSLVINSSPVSGAIHCAISGFYWGIYVNGTANIKRISINGCSSGIRLEQGKALINGFYPYFNTNGIESVIGSNIYLVSTLFNGNVTYNIYAGQYGLVRITSPAPSNTLMSPSLNTQGNEYGYISAS